MYRKIFKVGGREEGNGPEKEFKPETNKALIVPNMSDTKMTDIGSSGL